MPLLPDGAEGARHQGHQAGDEPVDRQRLRRPDLQHAGSDDQGDPGHAEHQAEPLARAGPLAEHPRGQDGGEHGLQAHHHRGHAGRDPARDAVEGAAAGSRRAAAGRRRRRARTARARPCRPSAARRPAAPAARRRWPGGAARNSERRGVGQPVLRADEAGAPEEHEQRRPPEPLQRRRPVATSPAEDPLALEPGLAHPHPVDLLRRDGEHVPVEDDEAALEARAG